MKKSFSVTMEETARTCVFYKTFKENINEPQIIADCPLLFNNYQISQIISY